MSTPEPQQLGSGGSGGDAQEVDMDTREDQAQKGSLARAGQETDGKTLGAQEEDAVEEGRGTEDKELRTQAPQSAEGSTELRRSSRAVARPDYVGLDNGLEEESQESQGYVPTRSQSRRAAMTDGTEGAAPSEAVLERPRRGERVNYAPQEVVIEDEGERVGAKKRVEAEPAQNEGTPKRKRGRPKNKPIPDPEQNPDEAAALAPAQPSTSSVVEPGEATGVEPEEDLMGGPPPVSTEPSTSSAGQPEVGKERTRKRKENGEGDVKPTKAPRTKREPSQKEGEEGNDEGPMDIDAEDSIEGPPPVSTEPSTSSAGQLGVSVKERARKRKKEKDPDWKLRRNPKSRRKPSQKTEGEDGNDEETMDVDEEVEDSEEKGEEPSKSRRPRNAVSKTRKKKDGDDVKENGPSSTAASPELDRTFYIFMPNAFAHTKKLEELKSFFFNIQRYQLRRLMEDTERDEEWLMKVLAYTNCIRAQFAYTHTWAACYALMLSPWGLDEETKKRILEKENDKKKCKKFLITPPLVSIPGIPELLQKDLWMLPATHHLHSIKEDQKDKGWIDKAARMVLVIFSKFSARIKDFEECGEAFLMNMLGFDKEVSRKILDSVKSLLLKDIVEEDPGIQDAEDPLHQMVAKLLVDKNTPSTSSAPPSRPEPPHSAGSLGLSTGPSTSTDPSGSSSPHHAEQSLNQQPPSDDKDAPQQDNETQTEQNTEWLRLIKKFRENMKDFEWAQEYQVYPSPFPHEVVLNMEEWQQLGQLKDRGKKDVKEKKRVVEKKIVAKKVVSKEGKGEVVTLRGVAVRFIVDDDEQGELRLERVGPEDSGANEDEDATVPVRCVERMIESVVIRPGVPVKDDEDDLQEDDQDQQPAQHVNRNLEMKKLRRGWVTRRQKAAQQSSGIQAATQEPQDLEQQASNAPEDLQPQEKPVASDQNAAPQHQELDELGPRAQQGQEGQQELATPDDPDKPAIVNAIVEDIRREAVPFLPAEVRNVESAADHQIEEERPIGNGADHQMEDQVVRPVEDEVNPQEEARPDQDMEVDHQGQAAAWDVEDFLMEDVRQVEEVVAGGQGDDEVPGYKQIFNLDTNTVVSVKDVIPGTSRNVATSPMRFDDSPETQQPSTSILQKAPDAEMVEDPVNSGPEVDELEFMGDNYASSVPRNDFEKDLRVEEAPETSTTSLVNSQSSPKKISSMPSHYVTFEEMDPECQALFRAIMDKNPNTVKVNPLAQNVEAMDVGAASSSQNIASKDASIQEDHVVAVTEPQETPGDVNELEPMDTQETTENSSEHSAEDEAMAVQNEANPQIEEPVVQESDQSSHASHKETSTRKDRDDQIDVDNAPEIEDETAESSTPPKVAVDQLAAEGDQRMDEDKNEQVTMGTGLNQEEANVGAASSSRNNTSKDAPIQEDHSVAVTEPQDALGDGIEPEPMDTNESAEISTEHSAVDEVMVVQNEANPQIEELVVQEYDQSFHAPQIETSTRKDRDDQMDVDNAPEIEDNETAETSTPPKVAVDQLTAEDYQRMDEEKNEQVTMGTGLNQEEANVGAASSSRSNASEGAYIQEDHVVVVTEPQETPGDVNELEPMDTQETTENSSEHSAEDEAMVVQNEANPQIVEPVVQENDQSFHAPHETGVEDESVSTSPEASTRKDRDNQMDVDNAPEIEDDVGAASSSPTTISKDASIQEEKKAVQEEIVEPEPMDTQETTENSNGVVQETSSELLVPPIEAEKDPDQTPMEIDSLPEGSLSQNEVGSVPGSAPGEASKSPLRIDSSTRTPTTPVTENLAPMLRCEHSAVDESIVVRSDKKKTNGQEKNKSEELSAVMNEENETAETSTPPKVAVDQLGSKPVDGEDPNEISPEKGEHVSPMFADVHQDQSSPKTPDDAQSSSTADSVVPTLDSSAEERGESQVKALPNPSSCSETLKDDQNQANTLPDSSSCSKISDAGSKNGSGTESLNQTIEPAIVEPIVEPIVDLVESLSLPSSSNRSKEAMEEAGLKDTLDGEEQEKALDTNDPIEEEQDLEDDPSQLPSDACSSSSMPSNKLSSSQESFDSNITDQGDLESMSRDDQEESDVDGSQSSNMPSSSAPESLEFSQEAGPSTSSPRAHQEDQISHEDAADEDQEQEAESPATNPSVQETVQVHFTSPTSEGNCHVAIPEARLESATLTIRRPEPIEEDEELDVPVRRKSDHRTKEAEPGSSGAEENMEIDQDLEDRPVAADQEPQEPTPFTQSTSTRYPSRFSPPASPQRVVRRVDADDLTDEAAYHNRLLKEIFEEPLLKGELSGSSRRFPQEENDDEPETQTLEEEEEEEEATTSAHELVVPLPTLPEPNHPTDQVASLENGAPLPPDQEARFLLLLQNPETPPIFLPMLNDVMKIHNLRKELLERTSSHSPMVGTPSSLPGPSAQPVQHVAQRDDNLERTYQQKLAMMEEERAQERAERAAKDKERLEANKRRLAQEQKSAMMAKERQEVKRQRAIQEATQRRTAQDQPSAQETNNQNAAPLAQSVAQQGDHQPVLPPSEFFIQLQHELDRSQAQQINRSAQNEFDARMQAMVRPEYERRQQQLNIVPPSQDAPGSSQDPVQASPDGARGPDQPVVQPTFEESFMKFQQVAAQYPDTWTDERRQAATLLLQKAMERRRQQQAQQAEVDLQVDPPQAPNQLQQAEVPVPQGHSQVLPAAPHVPLAQIQLQRAQEFDARMQSLVHPEFDRRQQQLNIPPPSQATPGSSQGPVQASPPDALGSTQDVPLAEQVRQLLQNSQRLQVVYQVMQSIQQDRIEELLRPQQQAQHAQGNLQAPQAPNQLQLDQVPVQEGHSQALSAAPHVPSAQIQAQQAQFHLPHGHSHVSPADLRVPSAHIQQQQPQVPVTQGHPQFSPTGPPVPLVQNQLRQAHVPVPQGHPQLPIANLRVPSAQDQQQQAQFHLPHGHSHVSPADLHVPSAQTQAQQAQVPFPQGYSPVLPAAPHVPSAQVQQQQAPRGRPRKTQPQRLPPAYQNAPTQAHHAHPPRQAHVQQVYPQAPPAQAQHPFVQFPAPQQAVDDEVQVINEVQRTPRAQPPQPPHPQFGSFEFPQPTPHQIQAMMVHGPAQAQRPGHLFNGQMPMQPQIFQHGQMPMPQFPPGQMPFPLLHPRYVQEVRDMFNIPPNVPITPDHMQLYYGRMQLRQQEETRKRQNDGYRGHQQPPPKHVVPEADSNRFIPSRIILVSKEGAERGKDEIDSVESTKVRPNSVGIRSET
ncbi:hypothetical protein CAEBREN_05834 [Caenorhabditis brenneri]|uniref:Uncharacterized protein n=1 Tax=Caenorhabditis brenneri TaxID=135651 RepID=G0MJ21_CAEBE|nr:hypothetical protein CAEBREN_05834 [Caenorhabditis brenneri]